MSSTSIIPTPFGEALSERYLVYALSTITARSLPDVRDGLKPVHRRILWAMRLLKLNPENAPKKCARVVGDVIGKYHPHGDQAVYDALVRLAQDFSLRYPLVEGQGNFGNIDGDNAAAMRYTEARLTKAALLLMEGVEHETVAFRPTYNGEEEEPEVYPAAFPNCLANGATGIAVGMATSIPPHNVAEISAAARQLIDNPALSTAELMAWLPGPDFPTGGILAEDRETLVAAYESGRGILRLRARWEKQETGHGTWQIVVSEIPWAVQKGRLIEQIARLIADKKLPILEDVRDESDTAVRLILEPKSRNVDADMLMESLFQLTELETRVSVNLNVLLKDRIPRVLGLKEMLQAWLDHRQEMLIKASGWRLAQIGARLELVGGYLIVYLNLDEVIRIIREEDKPRPALMAHFSLTERQAEAILNMRLRSLRTLEEMELRKEEADLLAEQGTLDALLQSPARQKTALKKELAALAKAFPHDSALGRRRTSFTDAPDATPLLAEALIEREPLTILLSEKGWIRTMKGHQTLAGDEGTSFREGLKFKEGDSLRLAFHAETTDQLLFAATGGRFFTLLADALPGGRGYGEPLSLLVDFPAQEDVIAAFPASPHTMVLLATSDGYGFVAESADLLAETRKGRQVVNLRDGETLRVTLPVPPAADHAILLGENRKLLLFPLESLPVMKRGRGVRLQRYRDGGLADASVLRLADGLSWPMGGQSGRIRSEPDLRPWLSVRGNAGRLPPQGFPHDGKIPTSPEENTEENTEENPVKTPEAPEA